MKKVRSLIIVIIIVSFLLVNNKLIKIKEFQYTNKNLPESFDGFVICHISDFHNTLFGKKNSKLVSSIKDMKPNLIAITGDIIDANKPNLEIVKDLIDQIKDIAPIYFVSGNHEKDYHEYDDLIQELEKRRVKVLKDSSEIINLKDENIAILGLEDPTFYREMYDEGSVKKRLEKINNDIDKEVTFKILLSHRPELFEEYVSNEVDLVLAGHAHGGQIRIPFVGGTFAPHQGFFPKYDKGKFFKNKTTMYVSPGLGNSVLPLRINNNPELIKIVLNHE